MAGPSNEQKHRSRTHPARTAIVVLLLLLAVAWPFLEIGPRGPLLVELTRDHGIDTRDLFALIPLVIAALLIWSALRHRQA